MKRIRTFALIIMTAALPIAATSCKESKGPAGKLGDKIDDALDNRPAEGIRDAVEDLTKEK